MLRSQQTVLFVVRLASSLSLSSWPSGAVALSSDSPSTSHSRAAMLHVISVRRNVAAFVFHFRCSAFFGNACRSCHTTLETTFRTSGCRTEVAPRPINKMESSSYSFDFVADKLETIVA